MSVDYGAVGGIGIEATDEIGEKLVADGILTEEELEERYSMMDSSSLKKHKIKMDTAGSAFSGEITLYFMVDGKNLQEVIENSKIFMAAFCKAGIELTTEDLKVVAESYIS